MNKELTFWDKTRKFFSPMKENKITYSYGILIYFFWGIDRVIHVIFLERIIHYLELRAVDTFKSVLVIYISYMLFYTLLTFSFRQKGWTEIRDTTIKFIQRVYLKQFINLENTNIERHGTGKLTAIINNGISRWGKLLDIFLIEFFNIFVSFLFTSYMLYRANEFFLFGFFIVYILVYISIYYLNLGAIKYRRKRRDNGNYHTKNLVKIIMNKQEIMQSDKIKHELSILDGYKDKEIYYNKKISNFLYPLFEGPNIILAILIILLFYYLGNSYLEGLIPLSTIVGLVSALIVMQGALERGIAFFKDFTKDFIDIEKLWDFFDNTPSNRKYNSGEEFIYKNGNFELKNIFYSYIKNKNVLSDFSLNISGGKITALVGNSGGGKSTIAKLVGGYINYSKGSILIDNQELNNLSMKSYYKNIGYLTQEPSIFDGTVLENLVYAVTENVDSKKIDMIIQMAKCEFIYDLPDGINTEIGERGIRLSGGQRQRLAIAKIMLKDPKIIILDEPTSALDSFSEDQITKAMNNLFKNRTVIIIAHRLQTVKNADKIYVIENGKIIEKGTHKELLKKKGSYSKMLELQSGF